MLLMEKTRPDRQAGRVFLSFKCFPPRYTFAAQLQCRGYKNTVLWEKLQNRQRKLWI